MNRPFTKAIENTFNEVLGNSKHNLITKDDNIMAEQNDTAQRKAPVDIHKEKLMEVRGIIDGCLDSGSTDYKAALVEILNNVNDYSEYSLN